MGCFSFVCKESGLPVASDSFSGDAVRTLKESDATGNPLSLHIKLKHPITLIFNLFIYFLSVF